MEGDGSAPIREFKSVGKEIEQDPIDLIPIELRIILCEIGGKAEVDLFRISDIPERVGNIADEGDDVCGRTV
jgi:uncharacterized protein Yka (UPF0111/DUF47 family)